MRWVWLIYRLPREPSSPRIAVWRKLGRLGVARLTDGVVALPLDARNREQLEWLADEVVESGGQAMVWLAEPTSPAAERRLVEGLAAERSAEYREVITQAQLAVAGDAAVRRRELRRLRGELRRIRQRDYFPPAERDLAAVAVADLAVAPTADVVVEGR
ncbi:MAG: chromate resistance protein [Actinobacteria bacterium]|jgi:hypothetical protein|nr:chromate resistance protein [Actinomycetota bacterium]